MTTQRLKDSPVTPINCEAAVLGSMLLDRTCIPSVRDIVADGSYFCLPEHGILYDELLRWEPVADAWDLVALRNRLQERRLYHAAGEVDYLLRLIESTPCSASAVYYAGQVHRGYLAREAMRLAGDLRRQLYDGCNITEQLEAARTQLDALAESCGQTQSVGLDTVTAHTITPEPLAWFWPNRIPAGMYSFIVGDPGAGKSFLSCYIAAIASTGGLWADGTGVGEAMDVLMFITEDNLAQTVVPRLNAHGTDLSRIHFCQSVTLAGGAQLFNIEQNMGLLERKLDTLPDCGLILFDPVTGFMGDVNQNSQCEVRGVLGRMCKLAEQRGVTIIGLSHLNKKVELDMRHRSVGSVAFNAVPRAVWGVFAQDEAEGIDGGQGTIDDCSLRPSSIDNRPSRRRFFFPIKDNLCVEPTALEFTIADGRIHFGRSLSAGELNAALTPACHGQAKLDRATRLTKKEHAKHLMLDLLKQGPCESDKLIEEVVSKGVCEKTVLYARAELRKAKKIDCDNPNGKGFIWFMVETL